jgi:hypothetical protein
VAKAQQQQHLQQQQQGAAGSVTQRVSISNPAAAAAAGLNGHSSSSAAAHHHHSSGSGAGLLSHHLHHGRAGDKQRQARLMLIRRLATWVALGVVALLVLGSLVPAAELDGGSPSDVLLDLGPYFFNPSIVRHRGVYLSTARTAHMKRIDRTNWWFNEAYICMSTSSTFKSVSCRKFDPWQG